MTPDEMFVNQNFYYPLGILLVGGIISSLLIPFFNFLNKRKLLDVQKAHEKVQKNIDRDREDYKFELGIKASVLEKLTEMTIEMWKTYNQMCGETESECIITLKKYLNYTIKSEDQIEDFIVLYLNSDQKLLNEWGIIKDMSVYGAKVCASKNDDAHKEKSIREYLEAAGESMTDEKIKEVVEEKTTDVYPDPLKTVFHRIRRFKLKIKQFDMNSS